MQVAESFIEEAGLNEGDEGTCDEEIEVPYFCPFCHIFVLFLTYLCPFLSYLGLFYSILCVFTPFLLSILTEC